MSASDIADDVARRTVPTDARSLDRVETRRDVRARDRAGVDMGLEWTLVMYTARWHAQRSRARRGGRATARWREGGWSVGHVAAAWRADARLDDAAGDACVE